MSNPRQPKKATSARPAAIEAVPDQPEEKDLPEGLKLQLSNEQQRLQIATMQAQLDHLSTRVAELTEENYNLKEQLK